MSSDPSEPDREADREPAPPQADGPPPAAAQPGEPAPPQADGPPPAAAQPGEPAPPQADGPPPAAAQPGEPAPPQADGPPPAAAQPGEPAPPQADGPPPAAAQPGEAAQAAAATSQPETPGTAAPGTAAPGATTPKTTAPGTAAPGRQRVFVLLALVLYAVLVVFSGARRDFWRGEPGWARVSQTMEASAGLEGWLAPQVGGAPWLETSPLYPALAALTRVGLRSVGLELAPELAYRLPTLLFALLGLWLTWRLGAELFDRRVGLLALCLQATTVFYVLSSWWLGPDLAFATAAQLGLTGLILGGQKSGARRWKLAAWLGLGLASNLGSAPAVLALVLVPWFLCRFFDGGLSSVRRGLSVAAGGFLWLLFPLLALPWYIHAWQSDPLAFETQHLHGWHAPATSFAGAGGWKFLVTLGLGCLPWTFFLPMGIFHGKDRTSKPGQRWCIYPFFGALLALVLTPIDRPALALFLWPPALLLVPSALYQTKVEFSIWERLLRVGLTKPLPWLLRLPLVLTVILGGLWAAGQLEPVAGPRFARLIADREAMIEILAYFAIGGVGCFFVAARVKRYLDRREPAPAVFETTRAVLFLLFLSALILPHFDASESARGYVEEVAKETEKRTLLTYGERPFAPLAYYLGRDIEHLTTIDPLADEDSPAARSRARLDALLASATPSFLVIEDRDRQSLRFLARSLHDKLHEAREPAYIGGEKLWLLATHAVAKPSPKKASSGDPEGSR